MVSTTLKTLILGLLLYLPFQTEATPYRIIVITPEETSSINSLTSEGHKKAAGLVGFLLGIPPKTAPLFDDMVSDTTSTTPAHPISFVGAPSTLSCIQTISPLADVIFYNKAPISVFTNIPESVDQFIPQKLEKLKETLYMSEEHDGKTAVICTKSSDVPTLLIQLEPRMRNSSNFQKTFSSKASPNQAFVITYKNNKPSFQVIQTNL